MGIVNGTEWIIIIAIIAVLIFGAKRLPEMARSFGKATSEYEKARVEANRELNRIKDLGSNIPENSKLREVAATLGIDCKDKNDKQLRAAIQTELNRQK